MLHAAMLLALFSVLLSAASAAPAADPSTGDLGIAFESGADLPLLKLPYATYRAKSHNKDKDYYHFANIRFAAPPLGELRWQKPQPPPTETDIQDGSVGKACHQSYTNNLLSWYFENNQPTSEDCLFLDVYVPGKAARGEVKNLPVLDWIYAGGYIFGSKDWFLYDTGMWLENADNDLIYVSGNHRVGAFGFLTGPTVQKEATSNVGFHDQRAVLQWIQDYAHLLGGDKNSVTAWGLSSGASSIMHHLIARGGKSDPLFQRAIVNSPAFLPTYDNASMETAFQKFAAKVDCQGKGIACLRQVPEEKLRKASADTTNNAPSGQFGFGPAIDNDYILDLPSDEFRKGNFWPNITLLFSHQSHEGALFTDPTVLTSAQLSRLVASTFPNASQAVRDHLLDDMYPRQRGQLPFARVSNLVGKFAVLCNVRYMAQAYAARGAYGYRLSAPPGLHGEDTFFNWLRPSLSLDSPSNDVNLSVSWDDPDQRGVAGRVQSLIASFARRGDPNAFLEGADAVRVPAVSSAEAAGTEGAGAFRVLDVSSGGKQAVVEDDQLPKDECDWWALSQWTGRAEDGGA